MDGTEHAISVDENDTRQKQDDFVMLLVSCLFVCLPGLSVRLCVILFMYVYNMKIKDSCHKTNTKTENKNR